MSGLLLTDRSFSCHCRERAAALLLPLSLVEIRDALLGYDMAYVVVVDHDGRYRHPCLLANLNCVQSLNECRNATALKGLYNLHDKLSTTIDRFVLRNQIKPRFRAMSPAMWVVSHIGRAAKPAKSPSGYGRRVSIGIHLQCRTDKCIDRILSG